MASRQRLRLRGAAAAPPAAPISAAVGPPPRLVLGCLPPELALCVLLHLPLKERVAAEAVCRGWRAALRAPALWSHLDLSPLGTGASDELALALSARSGGALRSLDVSSCLLVSVAALLRCAAAVGAAGPDARLAVRAPASWWSATQIDEALSAHPHLTLVDLECYADAVDEALLSALRQRRAEIATLVRDLRASRAAAVAPLSAECSAELEDAARDAPPAGPGVLREVSLHGATRVQQLWDLDSRIGSGHGTPEAGSLAATAGCDITVTAKHVRAEYMTASLCHLLRSRRIGLRELVIEELGNPVGGEGDAYLLAHGLRYAAEHYPEAAAAGEAAPRLLQGAASTSGPLPPAAVPMPPPPPPLPGASGLVGLCVSDCGYLEPQGAVMLLEALPVGCRCLEQLNVSGNDLLAVAAADMRERMVAALRALVLMPALRELFAERCALEDSAAEGLASGLAAAAAPGGRNACTRLLLAHNVIGDAGAMALAAALRARHPPALEELDLSGNLMGTAGGAALAAALAPGGSHLRDLRAYGNRGGGAGSVPALVALLAAGPACSASSDAAGELGDAAFDSTMVQDALVAAGGVPALLALLAEPADEPQGVAVACEEAAWALWAVASESAVNRDALCAAGAVPRLAATLAAAGAGALTVSPATQADAVGARSPAAAARDVTEKVCAVLWCLASTDAARRHVAASPGVVTTFIRLAELPPDLARQNASSRGAARSAVPPPMDAAYMAMLADGGAAGGGDGGGDGGAHLSDDAPGFWLMVNGMPAAPVPESSFPTTSGSHDDIAGSSDSEDEGEGDGLASLPAVGLAAWADAAAPQHVSGARLRLMAIGALTALALTPALRAELRSLGLLHVAEDVARAGPAAADPATTYQALLAVLLLAAPRAGGPQPPAADAALARDLLRSTAVGRRAARHLCATLHATLAGARGETRGEARTTAPDEGLYLECTWTVEEAATYIAAAAQVCPVTADAMLRRHRVGESLALALRSGAGGPYAVVAVCCAVQALVAAGGKPGRDALRRSGTVRALRAVARAASGPAGRAPPRPASRTLPLLPNGDATAQPSDAAAVAAAARACLEALDAAAA